MVYRLANEDKVLALAEALVSNVFETANLKNAKRVNRIIIDINRLAELDTEQLKRLISDLLSGSFAKEAVITLREMPIQITCRCGHTGRAKFIDYGSPACIKCGRVDVTIRTKKEPAAVLAHIAVE